MAHASVGLLQQQAWYPRLCQLAYDFTIDSSPPSGSDTWTQQKAEKKLAELLRRQNKTVEQFLVLSA